MSLDDIPDIIKRHSDKQKASNEALANARAVLQKNIADARAAWTAFAEDILLPILNDAKTRIQGAGAAGSIEQNKESVIEGTGPGRNQLTSVQLQIATKRGAFVLKYSWQRGERADVKIEYLGLQASTPPAETQPVANLTKEKLEAQVTRLVQLVFPA